MTPTDAPAGSEGEQVMRGDQFFELRHEVNRLFDEVLRGGRQGDDGSSATTAPRIDIYEGEDRIRICAELPGLMRDDIDVRLEGRMLIIQGEKRREQTNERTHITERFFGTFHRSISLPFRPDANEVQASFDNGVLQIVLHKPRDGGKNRRIEIDSAPMSGGNSPEATTRAEAGGSSTLILDRPLIPASSGPGAQGLETDEDLATAPSAEGVRSIDASPREVSASNRQMQTETAQDEPDTGSATEVRPAGDDTRSSGPPSYFGWRLGRSQKKA